MMRARSKTARPAFASTMTVLTGIVLLLIVAVLGRAVVHERTQQRIAVLAAQAEQVLLSARDWSRIHFRELEAWSAIELPATDLIATTATAHLELRRIESKDGRPLVECRLRIVHGQQRVARRVKWPLF